MARRDRRASAPHRRKVLLGWRANAKNLRSSTACRWQEQASDQLESAGALPPTRLTARAKASGQEQNTHPPAATPDRSEPKRKFLSAAICATNRVEFPTAVFRVKPTSPYRVPCGAIRRQRAARR